MIAVVAATYEDAWRYLEAGLPEPVFTVITDATEAVGVHPDAVVCLSGGSRELYDLLQERVEADSAASVQVPLHLLPTPLKA